MFYKKEISIFFQAIRFPSQVFILNPLFLGFAWATYHNNNINDYVSILLLVLYGLLLQFQIVFLNDYYDLETDSNNQNHTIYSGGSRVLVLKKVSPRTLYNASILCFFLVVCVACFHSFYKDNIIIFILSLVSLFLSWAYSASFLRISYRGGGEILQMLGFGFSLPLYGFYAQSGQKVFFFLKNIIFFLPLYLAYAVSTSLPDFESDKKSSKKSLAVHIGVRFSRFLIVFCLILSFLLFYIFNEIFFRELFLKIYLIFFCTLLALKVVKQSKFIINLEIFLILLLIIILNIIIINYYLFSPLKN